MAQPNDVARIQSSVGVTDQVLAPGVAGQVNVIHWVLVTSSAAGTVSVESGGTTRLFECYPDANGGAAFSVPSGLEMARAVIGEDLTITTTITGPHFVAVGYTRRPV